MPTNDDSHYYDKLAEFAVKRILRQYEWLIKPSRKHKVSLFLLQDIVDFLAEIPHLRKEKDQLCIGIVIKNSQTNFGAPLIEQSRFHISKSSNFLNLDGIVDGSSSCYIVDADGMVTIGQIPIELLKANSRLTLQNVSLTFGTLAFYVGNSNSEVYDSGALVQSNRNGVWLKPCAVQFDLLCGSGFPLSILNSVFGLCEKMSEMNKGCTFVIMKGDDIQYCSSMLNGYKLKKCGLDQIDESQIMKFASLDGAVVINVKSELLDISQRLEPPPSTTYCRESGRGARHNSAAMYSNAVDCIVFVVSDNGPITVYFKGDKYARCYGELFGSA